MEHELVLSHPEGVSGRDGLLIRKCDVVKVESKHPGVAPTLGQACEAELEVLGTLGEGHVDFGDVGPYPDGALEAGHPDIGRESDTPMLGLDRGLAGEATRDGGKQPEDERQIRRPNARSEVTLTTSCGDHRPTLITE